MTVGHDLADAALDEAFDGLRDFVGQFAVDHFRMYFQDADGAWHAHREFQLTGT